jgi:hypothetical protein
MNLRRVLLAAMLLVGCCAGAQRAEAQCNGFGYGYGFGGYWDIGRLYDVLADNVPYYAAFPPVYYSYPVARTYGYSPFAYPPGVMTPEIEGGMPLAIENPYFKGSVESAAAEQKAEAPAVNRTTQAPRSSGPLLVLNPHVVGTSAGR